MNNIRFLNKSLQILIFMSIFVFITSKCLSQKQSFWARYLNRLMDETKVENDIGKLFFEFIKTKFNITSFHNQILESKLPILISKFNIIKSTFKFYLVDSNIPIDIPLPGEIVLITKGVMNHIVEDSQLEFIIARNIYMLSKKIPNKILKKEGLYPVIIKELKVTKDLRNNEKIRNFFRKYIKAYQNIEHYKIDQEVIKLLNFNRNEIRSVLDYLRQLEKDIILLSPLELTEIDSRVKELEKALNSKD